MKKSTFERFDRQCGAFRRSLVPEPGGLMLLKTKKKKKKMKLKVLRWNSWCGSERESGRELNLMGL